jgi:hypothetical protein
MDPFQSREDRAPLAFNLEMPARMPYQLPVYAGERRRHCRDFQSISRTTTGEVPPIMQARN